MDITLEDVFIELNNSNKEKPVVGIFFDKSDGQFINITPGFYLHYWKYLDDKLLTKKVIGRTVIACTEFVYLEK